MPHDLTTAPANPAPKWPVGYIEALREAGAQEKTIPFCIHWIRKFFAEYPNRRRRDLDRMEIEAFLRKLAAIPNVSNWQVQQAREALEVYHERFRGIALASHLSAATSGHEETSVTQILVQPHQSPANPGYETYQKSTQPSHNAGFYTQSSPCVKAAVVALPVAKLDAEKNEVKIIPPSRSGFVKPVCAQQGSTGSYKPGGYPVSSPRLSRLHPV